MTDLERAILHIKTRADAWAVKEVTEALQNISERMDKVLSQEPTFDDECQKDMDEAWEQIQKKRKRIPVTLDLTLCDDAISREAINNLQKYRYNCGETSITCVSLKSINELPSVTQKSGKWIYDETLENWRCSKCNETPKTMGYVGTADFMAEHFKFCNHCGAKMEREEISERNMKMWEELFKAERGGKE